MKRDKEHFRHLFYCFDLKKQLPIHLRNLELFWVCSIN